MKFTMTARGVPALIFNGFRYLVHRKNASGKIYWMLFMWRISDNRRWCTIERKCCAHTPSELSATSDLVIILKIKKFGYVGEVTQNCR